MRAAQNSQDLTQRGLFWIGASNEHWPVKRASALGCPMFARITEDVPIFGRIPFPRALQLLLLDDTLLLGIICRITELCIDR